MFKYNPSDVYKKYEPRIVSAFSAGQKAGLRPASQDEFRTLALGIDNERDFIYEDGALPVAGALSDSERFLNWFYKDPEQVTDFMSTFDVHFRIAIFHASWWKDKDGNHPAPYTVITHSDIVSGKWIPIYDPEWSEYYVRTLEATGKKKLTIWPDHCILGTKGRRLLPAIQEAIVFASGARGSAIYKDVKGYVPHVEHYGAFWAEVLYPRRVKATGPNLKLLYRVSSYDRVYVYGQAKSHCVFETLDQYGYFHGYDRKILRKIWFLTDCSSSISGFEEETEIGLRRLEKLGINLVTTSDI
jgi:nicotinamidase/pyrazinamidase